MMEDSIANLISKLEALRSLIAATLKDINSLGQAAEEEVNGHLALWSQQPTASTSAIQKTLKDLRTCLIDSVRETETVISIHVKTHSDSKQNTGSHLKSKQRPKPYILEKPLANEDYVRYGRQLIIPQVGVQGQLQLKKASVLIIGIGGLGCPAAAYLAGAGVGRLGLVDGDTVELSNIHRQILHSTKDVGSLKVDSAVRSLREINPHVELEAYDAHINSENVWEVMSDYDMILDCTDHPTSRYLISDAAVILSKILVSASALRTDGQLMVLNYPATLPGDSTGGPCYRCVFPKPPPPESVVSCGEGGVLGPVVGTLGVLQAVEAIKILTQSHNTPIAEPSLLLYSAISSQPFRTVRLRKRKAGCPSCSERATISRESITVGNFDYKQFCGMAEPVHALPSEERISPQSFAQELCETQQSLLVDVRDRTQFGLCSLSGSINIPYSDITEWKSIEDVDKRLRESCEQMRPIRFVCRYGNDSQLAIQQLKSLRICEAQNDTLKDIEGGWESWRRHVDREWPNY